MLLEMVQRNSWILNCQTGAKQYKSQLFNNKKSPLQDFNRMSLGLLKNGRNLPPNQTNTIGSIISLLLQLGLLKIGAWEMEWSWWWCHEDRERFFQVLEFPKFLNEKIFCLAGKGQLISEAIFTPLLV